MIRTATENDAEALLDIYSYYVKNTAITFEYEVPSVDEFRKRIAAVLRKYPYLVSERNGTIVGYTYASPFKDRKAYDWSVETTIYTDKNFRGKGIGKELYTALEHALALQNIINLNACIAYPIIEDEYLTKKSAEFHENLGYRYVGEFYKCGYKFGRWYNMVWMGKCISDHPNDPLKVISFNKVKTEFAGKYGIQ